jgi:hypothetical protein
VLKPGCKASEHTIVHLKGTQPQIYQGEYEKGMTKSPIAIEPADANETMLPSSRLRLGRSYNIECNVKVRDIGRVAPEDKIRLLRYYQDEKDSGFEPDDLEEDPEDDLDATTGAMSQGFPAQAYYPAHGYQR